MSSCIFVDASLPAIAGDSPVVPEELLEWLRGKATDGMLPRWTTWWDEADIAQMFPDSATRAAVAAEEPTLPVSFYESRIPVPDGWQRMPSSYLLFGPPYDQIAAEASDRGWPVEVIAGEHLHQLVDPPGVARLIVKLAG